MLNANQTQHAAFINLILIISSIRANIQNGVLNLKEYLNSYEQDEKHGGKFIDINSKLLIYFDRAKETVGMIDDLFKKRKAPEK